MTTRTFLTSRNLLITIFFSYAFVVEIFINSSQRNYLVIILAILGGLLFIPLKLALQRQVAWGAGLFSIMILQALSIGDTEEFWSVALTFVYALGYFSIVSMLAKIEDKVTFVKALMRWVIYAFAIFSIIQLVSSLLGLPILNLIASKGLWSYNSLAYEPSQLGRVVGISMLAYLILCRLDKYREPFNVYVKVLLAFLITMLLSGSALAVIAIPIVIFLSRPLLQILLLTLVGFFVWPIALLIDFEPLQRFFSLIINLSSLDVDQVLEAEHSGGLRIAPLLVYLRDASISEFGFWFGYGEQGLTRFFLGQIPGLGDRIATGFIPGFAVVYGIGTTAIFIFVFLVHQKNRKTLSLIAFWFFFIALSAWNTQVFWYGLIVIQIFCAASRDTSNNLSSAKL